MKDVPTVNETVPGYVIDAWHGVWAPTGTPKEFVATLTEAWRLVASKPEIRARLAALSALAVGSTAKELDELIRKETKTWGDVVKARRITPAQ